MITERSSNHHLVTRQKKPGVGFPFIFKHLHRAHGMKARPGIITTPWSFEQLQNNMTNFIDAPIKVAFKMSAILVSIFNWVQNDLPDCLFA